MIMCTFPINALSLKGAFLEKMLGTETNKTSTLYSFLSLPDSLMPGALITPMIPRAVNTLFVGKLPSLYVISLWIRSRPLMLQMMIF